MSYTVRSSEKLRNSGAEHETKALLYLMNFIPDSDKIYYYVVDFFNDLTGMDNMASKLWDVQSKGAHNVSPNTIGKELVTLFKNYMSSIEFEAFILFLGSVTSSLRKDSTQNVFRIDNIKDTAITQIKRGLIAEGKNKTYINYNDLNDKNIDTFLNSVCFVIDDNRKPSEYVKAIIRNHPHIIPDEKILDAIFNEIRDKQAGKKNKPSVEGIVIKTTDEALNYCRHLTANEIRLLTLQRIINRNPLEAGIPLSFLPIYNAWPSEEQQNIFEGCQTALCRALFNKNAAEGFWGLFENTYNLIMTYPQDDINSIFFRLKNISNCTERCPDLDVLSLKFFIAVVKDGVQK